MSQNENLTDEEMSSLWKAAESNDSEDWNRACSAIKGARGGVYPPDWYTRVIASGPSALYQAKHGGQLKVFVVG